MLAHGMVPASVCATLGGYALSSLHRAAASRRLRAERAGRLLYINWSSFLEYVGETLAASLPKSAEAALERTRAD
jgi:hypothetical protein